MLSKIFKQKELDRLTRLLNKRKEAIIVSHLSPDGDALGSSLGLYHYLKDQGMSVNIIVPNSFPSFLNWMPGVDQITVFDVDTIKAQELIDKADLLFCLDFNTLSRVGQAMSEALSQMKAKKVMIDHHPYPDSFCDIILSHPQISSTSELIFRLICYLGDFIDLSKNAATCIYTGMMTDTGAFTYNSNHPEIYNIISKLITIGIDKDEIYRNVFDCYSVDRFRMQGYVLSEKLTIYEKFRTVMIYLTAEEQARFNYQKGDTEGFVNLPLSISNIVFSVFFRQDTQNTNLIKISLRSQGDFPCNQFSSEHFGGGGHVNAAGGEFYGSIEDAISIFEKHLPDYAHQLNKTHSSTVFN